MKYDWTQREAWGKTMAMVVAGLLCYLAFSAFCGVCLPVGQNTAIVVGVLGGFPVWVGGMCYAMLARSVWRAWGVLLGLSLVLGGSALLMSPVFS